MKEKPWVAMRVAVVTVSDTRTLANDTSGQCIADKLVSSGHVLAQRDIVADDVDSLRGTFRSLIDDDGIDVVISTGGTGITKRDVTPEAVAPWITKPIPGFGELFRWLSFQDIGTSTIQSRAQAALCDSTLFFLLPGSTGAVETAMDKIIVPQLDCRHRPCNFSDLLPRLG